TVVAARSAKKGAALRATHSATRERGDGYSTTYDLDNGPRPMNGPIQSGSGIAPVLRSDLFVSPGVMTFYTGNPYSAWKGNLFVGGLASTNLVRLTIEGDRVPDEGRLQGNMRRCIARCS